MKTKAISEWMTLSVDRVNNRIRVSARGSRGEEIPFRWLDIDYDRLAQFAARVEAPAKYRRPLAPETLTEAQFIERSLLNGDIGTLHAQLREASKGKLLVRVMVHDPELHAIPWEALCRSNQALGFWGTSPDALLARGVMTNAPWQPEEIRTTVRMLAIAPSDTASVEHLRASLQNHIATSEVEWLEPLQGPAATAAAILERLRRPPTPHIIHFIGHGSVVNGLAMIRVADNDDEENWLEVELVAQQLAATFRGTLRLIVLEACEGAKPAAFSSAAEILTRAGANAVVAHAWPVRADIARACSRQLYRSLLENDEAAGNVAIAMNEARRAVLAAFDASVEALAPVLFLQGTDGQLFDFTQRAPFTATAAPAPRYVQVKPVADSPWVAHIQDQPVPVETPANVPPSIEPPNVQAPELHRVPIDSAPDDDMGPLTRRATKSKVPLMLALLALVGTSIALAISLSTSKKVNASGNSSSPTLVISAIPGPTPNGPEPTNSPDTAPPDAIDSAMLAEADSSNVAEPVLNTNASGGMRLKTGSVCQKATQCQSNYCVDGVCCDSSCTGACKACSKARRGNGMDGTCGFIAAGKDPDNDCAKTKGARCDGRGVCSILASEPVQTIQSATDKIKKSSTFKSLTGN